MTTKEAQPVFDEARALERFQALIRIPTVSRLDPAETDWSPFDRFLRELPRLYPAVADTLERTVIDGHALLYRWAGRSRRAPTVLMAHYDVVGIGDGQGWTHPPFEAVIAEDDSGEAYVWGRGSFDDKASLAAILEAVEDAVLHGFAPEHDVYLAFSHNEEVLGSGTPAIVRQLASQGIRPRLVLDEGGIVGESIIPGATGEPVLVGVSEKGTLTLRISCSAPGGHASVPPALASTARIARAVVRLQDAPWEPFLNDVARELIRTLAKDGTGGLAEAGAVLDRDEGEAARRFSRLNADTLAMTRSAPLVTQFQGGHSWNAVPEHSWAIVTARIAPGHDTASIFERIVAVIDDEEIDVEVLERFEPSPVSPSQGQQWDQLTRAIRATYGTDRAVAPYVNNGGTDARNYTVISDHVYRFNPFEVSLAVRGRLHAIDERMRVHSFLDGCGFYVSLLREL
jgi:carboxypeptidase PM20D1